MRYVLPLLALCAGVALAGNQPVTPHHPKPRIQCHPVPVISNGHPLISNGHFVMSASCSRAKHKKAKAAPKKPQ